MSIIKRLDAIENEAKILRKLIEQPKYLNGIPGWFWDNHSGNMEFGYHGTPTMAKNFPHGRYRNPELTGEAWGYENFEPITQAILPQAIEHDGGEYPGDGRDIVIVETTNNKREPGFAGNIYWRDVKSYQLIKKA